MANLTVFSNANLPSVQSLSSSLRAINTGAGGDGGAALLKMDKTGHWVFGADQTEVEADATWAINPFSFVHGFIAWGDGEVLGEVMALVTQPLPATDPAPAAAKRGWEMQVGMSMRCMSGEDEGLEVRYTVTSVGGKKAVQRLALAIASQVDADPTKPVPVALLKVEHYLHKSYGRIYTPLFDVTSWIGMEGPQESDVANAPPVDAPVDTRRRRRPA